MPIRRRTITVTTENVLEGWIYRNQGSESLITVAASAAAAGETISYAVGGVEVGELLTVSIEGADRAIDMEADVIILQERVPAGEHTLAVTAAGADTTYSVQIDPIPGV